MNGGGSETVEEIDWCWERKKMKIGRFEHRVKIYKCLG